MTRIYFRADMRKAIQEGRKTMTSRTRKYLAGEYEAWSDGRKFATIRVTDSFATNWAAVLENHFAEEGFSSPEQMAAWAKANGLGHYADAKTLYTHTFKVVPIG